MTPGAYVSLRRSAARFTLHDVALRIDTDPPIAAAERERLLFSLEQGLTPMRESDAAVLATIPELAIDLPRLRELIAAPTVVPIRPLLVAIGGEAPR